MRLDVVTWCAALAAWSNAVLRGEVSLDRALDALDRLGPEAEFCDSAASRLSFVIAVGTWRSRGIGGWRYAPVAPGDSEGVPGPKQLQALALDAGAALVSVTGPTVALVPSFDHQTGDSPATRPHLRLQEHPADGRGRWRPESLGELDRELLVALNEATSRFDTLDIASWRDEVKDLLAAWDRPPDMPPATPDRARRLAARSGRVLALVEFAGEDHGGSRTASEMAERAEQLRRLARVARAAHAAAWNTAVTSSGVRG